MCSVCISKDGEELASKELNDGYSHAENLNTFILEILEDAKLTLGEIDEIAVSKGPGSYTGLRIGVSTAKGICFALDKPLIAVNTLKAMALGVSELATADDKSYICPMLDARRMEVYAGFYTKELVVVREVSADIVDDQIYLDLLNIS